MARVGLRFGHGDRPKRGSGMPVNLIVGNDSSNSLQGNAGADVIYGYNPDGQKSDASNIPATRVASGHNQPDGERGLLGLAFDPNYASSGLFYVYLIDTSGNTEIRSYHVSTNPNVADAASATPIITIPQPAASNHKAGWLGFGPDGYLYA